MIFRMWHGVTSRSKADAYEAFLEQRAIPDYRSVPGNLSVEVLRRDEALDLNVTPGLRPKPSKAPVQR